MGRHQTEETADIRQQTADSRQQTADSRQQTSNSRQQTADRRGTMGGHDHLTPEFWPDALVCKSAYRTFSGYTYSYIFVCMLKFDTSSLKCSALTSSGHFGARDTLKSSSL
jgi:hypothetical protein